MNPFNRQPHLYGALIQLRPLAQDDFDALFRAASDPLIWEQHPDRERHQKEPFKKYFESGMNSKGALAIVELKTGKVIGSSRFYDYNSELHTVQIGYTFLERAYWGGAYNTELKTLMLNHAFQSVEKVFFTVGEKNRRSQKALQKIGARPFEQPGCVDPGNLLFSLSKEDWTFRLLKAPLPLFEYPTFFRRLWIRYGWRALSKQFRKPYRRSFSKALIRKFAPTGKGLEIGVGAFTIAPVTRTLLSDAFQSHSGDASMAQVFFPAHQIPAPEETFSFILSEHVLEHIANPLRALHEWHRVLKKDGVLFLFLPHPERTFDRNRKITSLEHLLHDFKMNVPDDDKTHLAEWKTQVIDAGLAPHYSPIPIAEHPSQGVIHHHVFHPDQITEVLRVAGFKVIELHHLVPDRKDTFAVIASKA